MWSLKHGYLWQNNLHCKLNLFKFLKDDYNNEGKLLPYKSHTISE